MDWDVKDIVKEWQSGVPNYGFMVRDMQEYAPVLYSTQFFTHDQVPDEGYYPRLLVTYVTPRAVELLLGLAVAEGLFIIGLWRLKGNRSDAVR